MSNYAHEDEVYLASSAAFYGSVIQHVEEVALARGFVTRNGTVNINQLSEHSGVSTSTLWYLLRDKKHYRAINLVTLAKLCWALGVGVGELFEYVPGGVSNGLGYSSEAFTRLRGAIPTRSSDGSSTRSSDEGGDGGDSVRGTPNPANLVSTIAGLNRG
jgi:DNA-binding Xre family transcriptional regulator